MHTTPWCDTLAATNRARGIDLLPCGTSTMQQSNILFPISQLHSKVPRCKWTILRHHGPSINLCQWLRAEPLAPTPSANLHHAPTAGVPILYTHNILWSDKDKSMTNTAEKHHEHHACPNIPLPVLNTATSWLWLRVPAAATHRHNHCQQNILT